MEIDELGYVHFDTLHADSTFDENGMLCFLACSGYDGEAYVSKDEVIRLIEHLTTLVNSTADA